MNVKETGHLLEQPTKVSHFRPELGVFHGYTYERTANTVIEVWLPCKCGTCGKAIRTKGLFVRVGSATDEDIQRHGLKRFSGERQELGGKLHSESPYLCGPCKEKWLNGDALEELGETAEYPAAGWGVY